MSDPRLRFRIFVAGQLAVETWLDCSALNAQHQINTIRGLHAAIVSRAEAAGDKWLAEVWDPDLPGDEAYTRFGTDRAGMTLPVEIISWEAILTRPVETIHLPGDEQP